MKVDRSYGNFNQMEFDYEFEHVSTIEVSLVGTKLVAVDRSDGSEINAHLVDDAFVVSRVELNPESSGIFRDLLGALVEFTKSEDLTLIITSYDELSYDEWDQMRFVAIFLGFSEVSEEVFSIGSDILPTEVTQKSLSSTIEGLNK